MKREMGLLGLLAILCLLLSASSGCDLRQVLSKSTGNPPATQTGSSTPGSPADYEALLPPQIGSYSRTEKPSVLNFCSTVPDCDYQASADYKAASGEKVTVGVKAYKSSGDAKAALEDTIRKDTDYSASKEPGFDPSTDVIRFQIVKRTPTNNGAELLILDSLPRYPKSKEALWLSGNQVYEWIDVSGTKNISEVETLAAAFIQR
jgi:hypothetical protein